MEKPNALAIVLQKRGKEAGPMMHDEEEADEEKGYDEELHVVAQDLISAMKAGDVKGVAEALRASHDICDSEPHEEGEHEDEGEEGY